MRGTFEISWTGRLAACLFAVGITAAWAQQAEPLAPVSPGAPFPTGAYANLNAASDAPKIDLATVLGKKPIVLLYWIPGNQRSERMFLDLEKLVGEAGAGKLALFGVAVQRPGVDAATIRARLAALGIRSPVLDDEGFRIGQRLRVSSVPNVTIVDASGHMRLTNGASLRQVLGYDLDLGGAIRRVAASGNLMTHGYLGRYFPVSELEGEMSPDFRASRLGGGEELSWHGVLDGEKLNVLIFWSVDCPHCRKSLPEIDAWLREHPDGVNVFSCASVGDESVRTKTEEFCRSSGFGFPTLVDEGSTIGELYKVTSTPTIVIMGPDGVVDSTFTSGHIDFGRTIEEKKKVLLASGAS